MNTRRKSRVEDKRCTREVGERVRALILAGTYKTADGRVVNTGEYLAAERARLAR